MKRKAQQAGSPDWEKDLERLLTSAMAEKACKGLSESAHIAIHIEGIPHLFSRSKGENTLSRVSEADLKMSSQIDVHFWISESALRQIMEKANQPDAGIASIGISIFELLLRGDKKQKITVRVDSGFLTLWSKGYFSVMKAGGPEVASYLARSGFASLGRIKDALKKSANKATSSAK